MKAKELAEILLQHPETEVAFLSFGGEICLVSKVIKCNLATSKLYSFNKQECLLVDDDGRVRKSWLDSIKGEILNGDFVHDDLFLAPCKSRLDVGVTDDSGPLDTNLSSQG